MRSKGEMEHTENILDCTLYQVPPIMKISWKSVHAFFRNVTNRKTDKPTEMIT